MKSSPNKLEATITSSDISSEIVALLISTFFGQTAEQPAKTPSENASHTAHVCKANFEAAFAKAAPNSTVPPAPTALKFGNIVKDSVTGFSGIVTAFCQYATGCNQVLVQPTIDDDGKYVDAKWFDIERITFKDVGKPITTSPSGGARHTDTAPIR